VPKHLVVRGEVYMGLNPTFPVRGIKGRFLSIFD
jgi:hypothetical protein